MVESCSNVFLLRFSDALPQEHEQQQEDSAKKACTSEAVEASGSASLETIWDWMLVEGGGAHHRRRVVVLALALAAKLVLVRRATAEGNAAVIEAAAQRGPDRQNHETSARGDAAEGAIAETPSVI